ncbi:MAG: prepilin-type N-terminal cleavage/methylation domain-containing protein [Clostridium sp.]
MNKLKKRKKGGFTLIEMVVVIAIVVIIAAIAIPQALKAINKSKASTDIANARTYAGQIMAKVANGDIQVDNLKGDATTPAELTDSTPVDFGLTVATPKLLKEGKFYYAYDKVKEEITIYVIEDKKKELIYPSVAGAEYIKYINPTKTTP